jgi:hypothetical protein
MYVFIYLFIYDPIRHATTVGFFCLEHVLSFDNFLKINKF